MLLKRFPDKRSLSHAAADQAATAIRRAIADRTHARIIAATGASQLDFLDTLTTTPNINWAKVEAFHLDEYIGLPITHPASFRKFLMENLVRKTGIVNFHQIDGDDADPSAVAREVGEQLASAPIDVAFLGIGVVFLLILIHAAHGGIMSTARAELLVQGTMAFAVLVAFVIVHLRARHVRGTSRPR